ncbi:MAG: PilZ domain-containing protein [Thermodesulfobacteriota bacterium]
MIKKEKSPFDVVNVERRKHPRFLVGLPVEYWKTYHPLSQPSRMINISEGGVLFHISEPIEIGENLKLKILTDSRLNLYPIEALVKVLWKDAHLDKNEGYRIGAKFVEISQEDRDNLRNFLDNLTNLKPPSSKIFSEFASILTGFFTPNLLKPRIEKPGR